MAIVLDDAYHLRSKLIKPSIIVFDAFGTLVKIGERRSPYRRLMRWMRDSGRKPIHTDAAVIMSNTGDFSQIAALFGMTIPDDLLVTLNSELSYELQSITLFDDTISTLQQLKIAGFRLALCSNLAMPYGSAVLSLLPPLDAYAWSYEIGAIKPDAQIYQSLINQLNCLPENILFIGDTPLADVQGPLAFGMQAKLIDRKGGQSLAEVLGEFIST